MVANAPTNLDVPYFALASLHAPLKQDLLAAVSRVLDRGDFVLGAEVADFEERFAQLAGTRYAIAVHSVTDALALTLRAVGVRDGDEVITAPNSSVTTASAIVLAGCRPVFVDSGPDYNIDPMLIEAAITPRTRVILPVHMTGRPADMDAISSLAAERGLIVVEDASQAVLARYRDKPVGSLGHVGCFSLGPQTPLGACGDGGVITTDDEELVGRLRIFRNNGEIREGEAAYWCGSSRLDTVQAAMLLAKMDCAHDWTERRRLNAAFYQDALCSLPGIEVPRDQDWEYAVYCTFVIQAERRDELARYLEQCGIGTAIDHPVPIHLQPVAAASGYRIGDFPKAEEQAKNTLSLPIYPALTRDQLQHVAQSISTARRSAD